MEIDKYGTKVDRTLQKGDTGLAVALWQIFLIRRKKMNALVEDDMMNTKQEDRDDQIIGEFENATVEATKKYQRDKGLKVDGVLDSKTYAKAAIEGFNGNEVEAAILLGLNRIDRSLIFSKLEIVFSRDKIIFKVNGQELTANEALKKFRALDGIG